MHGIVPTPEGAAISDSGKSAAERSDCSQSTGSKTLDGKSAVDDWFGAIARNLLPEKPGTALHYITGYDERLCQRYAAGHVRPSAYFLRALLRSDHGAQWLAALMDGSTAPWWRDLARERRLAAVAERFKTEIDRLALG